MKVRIKKNYERKYKSEFSEILKKFSKAIEEIDFNNEEEVLAFLKDFNDNIDYVKHNMMGIYAKISIDEAGAFEEVEGV